MTIHDDDNNVDRWQTYISLRWRRYDVGVIVFCFTRVHIFVQYANFLQIIPARWSVMEKKTLNRGMRIDQQMEANFKSLTLERRPFPQLRRAFGMVSRKFDVLDTYRGDHSFYLP